VVGSRENTVIIRPATSKYVITGSTWPPLPTFCDISGPGVTLDSFGFWGGISVVVGWVATHGPPSGPECPASHSQTEPLVATLELLVQLYITVESTKP